MRVESFSSALARHGFSGLTEAAAALHDLGLGTVDQAQWLISALGRCDDPDLALSGLTTLCQSEQERQAEQERPSSEPLLDRLASNEILLRQLTAVLGASIGFHQGLRVQPDHVQLLAEPVQRRSAEHHRRMFIEAVGADPDEPFPVATEDRSDDLRIAYRGVLLQVAARDLTLENPLEQLEEIAAELSDMADAVIEAGLALARLEVGPDARLCRLGVVALGKCGGRELNYVSDVDVLFVAEPALDDDGEPLIAPDQAIDLANRLAAALTRTCSAHTAAGTIWPLDAALRPEGKAGPLVRTLEGMSSYYSRWAKSWEFQAMLKARPMAGSLELAQEFVDMVSELVWTVADRDNFIPDLRAMRRRVIKNIPANQAGRELKLGEGGLRDVEFTVQMLQLVHGRADERIHEVATLPALRALAAHGYIGRGDGVEFAEAYAFTRVLEHRVQLYRLRRTHLLPADEVDLRRLSRSVLGRELGPDKPSERLLKAWRNRTRKVFTVHRRLFYSPLLEAVSNIPGDQVRLTEKSAHRRLAALGYSDPKAALQHIQALSRGSTRQAEIQRQLLPAMLGWFAEGSNPDFGLLSFRRVSEELGRSPWYLRGLRDEGAMAERFARVLSSSRYAVNLLNRSPQAVQLLASADDLQPRDPAQLVGEMRQAARRHDDPAKAVEAVRGIRRRELFRLAAADIDEVLDLDTVGVALSACARATIHVALEIAQRGKDSPAIGVIALGRWGGGELSYASDADVMFVTAEASTEADRISSAVIGQLRQSLGKGGIEPALMLDADLRPEGRGGPMVRSLAAYRNYYQRWSATWEIQAMVRAAPGAGDENLNAELMAVIDALRWRTEGLSEKQVYEIRRLKARMEAERLPRGADRKQHLKLGPGGLSDVEWTAQLLQLQHGAEHEGLRTPHTLTALEEAVALELLEEADAGALSRAWTMASRMRNRITLVRAKASDTLPHDSRELSAVAELMGYGPAGASHLVADYQRIARHARTVVDNVFWGLEE